MGEEVLAGGDAERALAIFDQLVEMAPEHPRSLRAVSARWSPRGGSTRRRPRSTRCPPALPRMPAIDRAQAALALAQSAPPVDDLSPLIAAVEAAPDDLARAVRARQRADGGGRPRCRGGHLLHIIAADRDVERGRGAHAVAQAVRGGRAGGPVGVGAAPAPVGDPVRMSETTAPVDLPAAGRAAVSGHAPAAAHLRAALPRDGVSDAMARDRRIGMIQPPWRAATTARAVRYRLRRPDRRGRGARRRPLQSHPGGRGAVPHRPRTRRHDRVPPGRGRAAARCATDDTLSLGRRSSLELESRRFADAQGYAVDWDAVGRLDDESLVNGIAQIAPFDAAAKQALLEAPDHRRRAPN